MVRRALEGDPTDLWLALDVMLLGTWLHARVLWYGLHDLLRTMPDAPRNVWKRKAVLEISVFPKDVLSEGLVNSAAAAPSLGRRVSDRSDDAPFAASL